MKRYLVTTLAFAACASNNSNNSASKPATQSSAATAEAPAPEKASSVPKDPPAAETFKIGVAPKPVPADTCPRWNGTFTQPVAVEEDTGFQRSPPVAGFPMAFERGAGVRSLTGFYATTRDGKRLPTQGEVLSRWGAPPGDCNAPIRWAYFFVLADLAPKARSILALRHDPGAYDTRTPMVSVQESDKAVVVDTGAARFTVRRDWFNGLSKVEIKNGAGWTTLSDVPSAPEVGLLVERQGRVASPIHGKVASFELERKGPTVATLAVKGTYAIAGEGPIFRYTVRFSFYAGSASVLVDHTYYHGKLESDAPSGATNRQASERVLMRIPVDVGDAPAIVARAAKKVHQLGAAGGVVAVQQDKRAPDRPLVVSSVRQGGKDLEIGTYADAPLLAVEGKSGFALATIAYMGPRDPQALRYDPKAKTLEVDWQSEELFVGGARGIWSRAVLAFGAPKGPEALVDRGNQAYAHAARPLIGVPTMAYLNSTRVRPPLPTKPLRSAHAKFDRDVDTMHARTVEYLRKFKITGTQIWPDMPRQACYLDGNCDAFESGYFPGGDCNYWDWSLAELEEFLRTADPAFVHDFALGEAMTMAETVSFRPDPEVQEKYNFAGMSPCYGGGEGYEGPWREGLNHRVDRCPGDYSYNKVHKLAYVLTADRRFTDFFDQGGSSAIVKYLDPPAKTPGEWQELSAARMTYQYLEQIMNAAEFGRIGGDAKTKRYEKVALSYFEFMRGTALLDGHTCFLLGSGKSDPKTTGKCFSDQAWMLPGFLEWVLRVASFYDHEPARAWLLLYGKESARHHTVLGSDGLPDISARNSSSGDDASNGWRTNYECRVSAQGVDEKSCTKITNYENDGRFYNNGLVAYLNTFGVVLGAEPKDPLKICKWLPSAYKVALDQMVENETNALVWGKAPGEAYGMTQAALGAIESCPE